MAAKTPEMDSNFARWYADAFMDEGAVRDARWKSVVDIAAKANHVTIEVLVRLAFATKASATGSKSQSKLAEAYDAVVASISSGGHSFDAGRSARELQVLAAAVLVRLFGTKPDAAIAVTTAAFGGHRSAQLPMNFAELAEQALVRFSVNQHTRADEKSMVGAASKLEFEVSEEAVQNNSGWKEQIEGLRDEAAAALQAIIENQNRINAALLRRIALSDEELQMLWWLTAGESTIQGKPFGKVSADQQPLILAQELATLTAVSPGPKSISAMFGRAGISNKKVKVADVVNSVDIRWAREVSGSESISPVTTPLHFALEQRVELDSNDAWQSGWTAMTELKADTAVSAVELATLFYREYLYLYVDA